MIKKTRNYEMFKFREDNRAQGINKTHLGAIKESIRSRNMLEFRPIIVNSEFEIMDGQHRLLAAKELGIDIYYEVSKEIDSLDIIKLNVACSWGLRDYHHFYVKNGYQEYIKLNEFMKRNQLSLHVALHLIAGDGKKTRKVFRDGTFVFNQEDNEETYQKCWSVIDVINRFAPSKSKHITTTSRFWSALAQIVAHPDFVLEKFLLNIRQMIERVSIRASKQDYIDMFTEIYNWRNIKKIKINEEY